MRHHIDQGPCGRGPHGRDIAQSAGDRFVSNTGGVGIGLEVALLNDRIGCKHPIFVGILKGPNDGTVIARTRQNVSIFAKALRNDANNFVFANVTQRLHGRLTHCHRFPRCVALRSGFLHNYGFRFTATSVVLQEDA
ncbi:MAG: hypothetical protein O3C57_00945 [Verrucomicrobia bacterium]|nr:hypothetical protein [Verrucomicrobiota bacterium]